MANADVRLAIYPVEGGTPVTVDWDRKAWPYLCRVHWAEKGPLAIYVMDRRQQEASMLSVDPATTEIRVTYSKNMRDGSWSWSTWGEENMPKMTGKPHYMDDKRTCVAPVKLEPNKFYAIWLNSENFGNFKDAGGRPAVPYLLVFKTKG
jgi:RNA polymerase sigma-70 factor (ECF subfamily)